MVLGREDADSTSMVGVAVPVIYRQHGHRGEFRVGWQEGRHVEESAQRQVAEVGGGAVVADHAVGQHRERIGLGAAKDARPLDA